jgi:Ca2+-binding RTX toxin-like protein
MSPLRAAPLAALLALAALPSSAHAAAVAYGAGGNSLEYVAGGGEANRLAVTEADGRIVFSETGGVLIATAEADCDGAGTGTVSCKVEHLAGDPVTSIGVDLADLDDELVIGALPGMFVEAVGGGGPDRLDGAGSAAALALLGGAGGDRLLAGTRDSFLEGGPDADTLTGGAAGGQTTHYMGSSADGADVIAGGPGLDIAAYDSRLMPMNLSADGVANDGEAGEGDDIRPGVEAIQGGARNDTIGGSAVVDAQLSGYGGDDLLAGAGGDDVLFGGTGDDTLLGGGGDDSAAAGDSRGGAIGGGQIDGGADRFRGGTGFDTADYSTRFAPVTVTLDDKPGDGEAGEGDDIGADVEGLIGGRGADVLTGNAAAQRISSGSGGDTIDPGAGVDDVRAGDGDDAIKAQDATADAIACGLGTDSVSGDGFDLLDACEALTLGPPPLPPDTRAPKVRIDSLPARPRFRHVKRGLRPRLSADEPVSYLVELLGRATRAHIAARRPYNLTLVQRTIPRTARARRITLRPKSALLGARRKLRVRIRVTATDAAGNVTIATRTLRARR